MIRKRTLVLSRRVRVGRDEDQQYYYMRPGSLLVHSKSYDGCLTFGIRCISLGYTIASGKS